MGLSGSAFSKHLSWSDRSLFGGFMILFLRIYFPVPGGDFSGVSLDFLPFIDVQPLRFFENTLLIP